MSDAASPAVVDWGLGGSLSVVVGGSEGIGAAVAVGLARAGSTVVVGGRDLGRLQPTVEACEAAGGRAIAEVVDARDPGSIESFGRAVLGHGTPSVLVNSMGGTNRKPALEVTVPDWDDLYATHVRGTFLMCQTFAPAMRDAGYGKIVNMSSIFGVLPPPNRVIYASAKSAIDQLTKALAVEWGGHGIRVNAIAPGTTRTPRFMSHNTPEREREQGRAIPLGRIADPEDMVGPTLFFASPASDYVTGQTLLVDGGWTTTRATLS